MKFWIFSVLLISLAGCKKDAALSENHKKDTTSAVQKTINDSLSQKPTQPEIFAFAEWGKLREEMSKKNGNPQRIITEFENHFNSSNWKEYAIIDLITFGWGNCANNDIERPLHDEKMNNEFNGLFIKIDSECDEP